MMWAIIDLRVNILLEYCNKKNPTTNCRIFFIDFDYLTRITSPFVI